MTDARQALTTAHDAIENLRGETLRDVSRRQLSQENAAIYRMLVTCCLNTGDDDAALHYAVAGKGRAYVDLLASQPIDREAASADDPQLRADLAKADALAQHINNLTSQRMNPNALTDAGSELSPEEQERRQKELLQELLALRQQERALYAEIAFNYPALSATIGTPPELSSQDLQTLASALGATLVEVFQHDQGFCAFVIQPDALRVVPLPEVGEELFSSLENIIEGDTSPLVLRGLAQLEQALFQPLALPEGSRVIVAAAGALHKFPLHLARDAQGRYALDRYDLSFVPSLAALHTSLQQRSRRSPAANPPETVRQLLVAAYPGAPNTKYYLQHAVQEAQAIQALFTPQVTFLDPTQATAQAVVSHAPQHRYIHFACHGVFDAEDPENAHLLLSDGRLRVRDIIQYLHSRMGNTQLMTVGACQTARADLSAGEELTGLTQALLTTGTGGVVTSLWNVDDASTKMLFTEMYSRLKQGEASLQALHEAMRTVREYPKWQHPRFWGAFQLHGLPEVLAATA